MKKTLSFQWGYRHSKAWLIFWLICFFPVGIALLATGLQWQSQDTRSTIYYNGSRFWLCFWALFFFPVALILGAVSGFTLEVESPLSS
ncbi:MAG: hypothetical protein KDK78_09490 [Chlamydiia bacterium]|nr:hypothetical protein [Chlamydiia bacterium]